MTKYDGALLITGAAGDIGRATAKRMARDYKRVYILDKDGALLDRLSEELPNARSIVVDVTDPLAVAAAFDEAAEDGLRSVVLGVGTEGPVGLLEDCSVAEFTRVMTTNVLSVFIGLQHALRLMKPMRSGSIVALSSISGVMGMQMLAPYAASKHAVMGLVRTAAREAAGSNVRVNAVCPAPVASKMMNRIDGVLADQYPERLGGRSDASHSVPMQRYGRPDEVANAIAFLCSEESGFCTGNAFMLDGGISCR